MTKEEFLKEYFYLSDDADVVADLDKVIDYYVNEVNHDWYEMLSKYLR